MDTNKYQNLRADRARTVANTAIDALAAIAHQLLRNRDSKGRFLKRYVRESLTHSVTLAASEARFAVAAAERAEAALAAAKPHKTTTKKRLMVAANNTQLLQELPSHSYMLITDPLVTMQELSHLATILQAEFKPIDGYLLRDSRAISMWRSKTNRLASACKLLQEIGELPLVENLEAYCDTLPTVKLQGRSERITLGEFAKLVRNTWKNCYNLGLVCADTRPLSG